MAVARCCGFVALAAAAVVGLAPTADAASVVAYAPTTKVGPALTGDAVAWGEGREAFSRAGRFRLRLADAAGAIRTVLTVPDTAGARPRWTRLLGGAGLAAAYDVVRDSRDPAQEPDIRSRVVTFVTAAGAIGKVAGEPLQLRGTTLLVDRSDGGPARLALVDLTGAEPDRDVTPAGLDDADALPGVKDARIAGDFEVVAREAVSDDLNGDVLVTLFRRSTGARVYNLRMAPVVWTIADLAPDGRLLLAEQLGAIVAGTRYRLHVLDPVAKPATRLVAPLVTSGDAVLVGDAAIASGPAGGRGAQPTAFGLAGGTPRPLGAPATAVAGFDATSDTVAWRTDDGCVLRAALAAPADDALPPGACPRAALTFPPEQGLTADRHRVLRIRVGCPGAPPPGCVGMVKLGLSAAGRRPAVSLAAARVAVPPGRTREVALRLSRSATRIAARRGGDALLRATIADPAGHKRTTRLEFFLEVPGTPPV